MTQYWFPASASHEISAMNQRCWICKWNRRAHVEIFLTGWGIAKLADHLLDPQRQICDGQNYIKLCRIPRTAPHIFDLRWHFHIKTTLIIATKIHFHCKLWKKWLQRCRMILAIAGRNKWVITLIRGTDACVQKFPLTKNFTNMGVSPSGRG